jgi:hypothetical protein
MRFHIEQAQFEYGEQSTGTRANNQHIGFDRFAHLKASSRLNPPLGPAPSGCACLANAAGSGKP